MGQMCEWNLKKNFNWGHFFKKLGAFFFKLGAKNYFGIEKISFFGNYIDPCSISILVNSFKCTVQLTEHILNDRPSSEQ